MPTAHHSIPCFSCTIPYMVTVCVLEVPFQDGFNKHWGWFSTIYHLSQTSILSITGDDSIPQLNFVFVLNYLAYEQDKNNREEQKRKQQERQYRIK